MKLTDDVRGMTKGLAAASRQLWVKTIKPQDWRVRVLRTVNYWRGECRQVAPLRLYLAATVAFAFFFTSTYTLVQHMKQTGSWNRVYNNGTYVGMVPNDQQLVTAMNRIAFGYHLNLEFYPVHTAVKQNYDWQKVATLPTPAVAIVVNGRPVVYTKDRAAADAVLAGVRRLLSPAHVTTSAKISFVQKVSVSPVQASVMDILPVDAALRYLLRPQLGHPSGRHESVIPVSFVRGPLVNFPQASTKAGPMISVKAMQSSTRVQALGFPVDYQSTDQLGSGVIKVLQHGSPGKVKQVVENQYVNGQLVSERVVKQTMLQAPRAQIAERGTNTGLASGTWVWPTTAYDVTSPFGWRTLDGVPNFHPGIDLGVPLGTPIYATNNGVIEDAGWNSGGYGIWAKINNGGGIETVFGHMSNVLVHSGEIVAKGQLIGYSGETGFATGPHLHYEVRLNGSAINPAPYM